MRTKFLLIIFVVGIVGCHPDPTSLGRVDESMYVTNYSWEICEDIPLMADLMKTTHSFKLGGSTTPVRLFVDPLTGILSPRSKMTFVIHPRETVSVAIWHTVDSLTSNESNCNDLLLFPVADTSQQIQFPIIDLVERRGQGLFFFFYIVNRQPSLYFTQWIG